MEQRWDGKTPPKGLQHLCQRAMFSLAFIIGASSRFESPECMVSRNIDVFGRR
jgi:hypothetical protein